MEKLISMTDFVLEQSKITKPKELANFEFNVLKLKRQENYANFLKLILELWMFVPAKLVNGEWIVLEEPDLNKMYHHTRKSDYQQDLKEYQEAKDRVLFEGFEVFKSVSALISFSLVKNGLGRFDWNKEGNFMMGYSKESTIEDLFNSHYVDLFLTESAKKQIGIIMKKEPNYFKRFCYVCGIIGFASLILITLK